MARELNLVVNQNETFLETVTITNEDDGTPFDLTGYTITASMQTGYGDSPAYLRQGLHPLMDDPTTGILTLNLTYLESAALRAGRWVYDCFALNNSTGNSIKLLWGLVTIRSTAQ